MRILLIEDDSATAQSVLLMLKAVGLEVDTASFGQQGVERAKTDDYDLILLDLILPDMSGFQVLRALRGDHIRTPVLVLSSLDGVHDKAKALGFGADDYLTKPFAPKELSARIRALLRRVRPSIPGHPKLVFGDLEIIPDEGKVSRGGHEVHLTKTEFRLLCELAESPGRVFSRELLLDKVWGYDYFGDGRLVDVHVRRLRTKVELDPANPRHVVTVRGLGYRLQA